MSSKIFLKLYDQLRSMLPHLVHVILRILLISVRKMCNTNGVCDNRICDAIQNIVEEQKGDTK